MSYTAAQTGDTMPDLVLFRHLGHMWVQSAMSLDFVVVLVWVACVLATVVIGYAGCFDTCQD